MSNGWGLETEETRKSLSSLVLADFIRVRNVIASTDCALTDLSTHADTVRLAD
jgi:hypothetical protein